MPKKPPPKPPAKPRQTKDPVTHRFQSVLTRDLCDQLCDTHGKGRDFRNATAIRCGVHPVLLTRWLKLGANDPEAGLATELFMRMGKAECDYRADLIKEVADPTSMTEVVEYDDGKPIGKTTVARRTQGLQWLLERRFRQFRADALPKPDDLEISVMLEPAAASEMNQEAALQIITMIASNPERLPPALLQVFLQAGWALPATASQKVMTDGQATAH